jgi:hypothetical protein
MRSLAPPEREAVPRRPYIFIIGVWAASAQRLGVVCHFAVYRRPVAGVLGKRPVPRRGPTLAYRPMRADSAIVPIVRDVRSLRFGKAAVAGGGTAFGDRSTQFEHGIAFKMPVTTSPVLTIR